MSLGLIYPPSSYGAIDEFVYLARILKKHEAILAVHMRSESTKIFEAIKEMLEVARQSKVHLEISHLKLIGKPQWGKADQLLQMIKEGKRKAWISLVINIPIQRLPRIWRHWYLAGLKVVVMRKCVPAWQTQNPD